MLVSVENLRWQHAGKARKGLLPLAPLLLLFCVDKKVTKKATPMRRALLRRVSVRACASACPLRSTVRKRPVTRARPTIGASGGFLCLRTLQTRKGRRPFPPFLLLFLWFATDLLTPRQNPTKFGFCPRLLKRLSCQRKVTKRKARPARTAVLRTASGCWLYREAHSMRSTVRKRTVTRPDPR